LEPAWTYLKKHAAGDSLIQSPPEKGLKYIVVIPAYLETRLEDSLVSLFNAAAPANQVEVIIVVNWPEDASREDIRISHNSRKSAVEWADTHSSEKIRFHVVEAGFIPRKKAGVGYARKTGMDEAVRRFLRAGQDDGIIISFDADTRCDPDYLTSIEEHFRINPMTDGCSIYFEHPLEGQEFPQQVYEAIIQYELHMRCYLHSIKYTGFPNAFYTVGSALAVRAAGYCRQGGMNIRQAGEDFYFLQKFFDLGNFTDLLKTRVCPSPRPSLRVPFGTGKAIDQLINSDESLKSYHPSIFEILKEFFESVPLFYQQLSIAREPELSSLNPCLLEFLGNSGFSAELLGIYNNSGNPAAFKKRFYRYFNMFRILKFARHARKVYPDLPVHICALTFLQKTGMNTLSTMSESEMLREFRRRDRETSDLR
jgi:hypothetical protein